MKEEVKPGINQEQVHNLLFNREVDWQEIIYDLINSEQLDPWNIDIGILSEGFLVKIREYEEMDFFVSSKVLLAAALLLRIKSELILSKYMRSIDSILFGEKEEKKNVLERIELNEEIPELVLRSPIPRFRKVTLNELIESLNKAIITENRRIKKAIVGNNALREAGISLSKRKYNIKDKLKAIHDKIINHFVKSKKEKKVTYTEIVGIDKEERALSFFPVIQLESSGKIWLEQENPFEEIHIWLKHVFLKENPDPYADLKNGDWSQETIEEGEILTEKEENSLEQENL
ncbi:segregation/condensation protein A [Candidatus Pacearchaeota archaeon]|nr:segregation/condensation protein A [Candidatus Pacearchaeota archaeon]